MYEQVSLDELYGMKLDIDRINQHHTYKQKMYPKLLLHLHYQNTQMLNTCLSY